MTLWPFRGGLPLRYQIDRSIRRGVMRVIGWLAPKVAEVNLDPRDSWIKKILLVRANFRMGNALLALPAIAAFRNNFPGVEIDFVGSPISQLLFRHQPLDRHFITPRRFPRVVWEYPHLMQQLRDRHYDLAVDVSCSHSGVASFIVGLSGARIRVGMDGKWDQLFNLKITKLADENKYRKMTAFLTAMHLQTVDAVGAIQFAAAEKMESAATLESTLDKRGEPLVGVFVGGRKLRDKRWPLENFVELTNALRRRGVGVVAFLGPEEYDIADVIRATFHPSIPVILEPSVRKFAAMIAHLGLFICCDSGPMHLACAVGVRTLAIFQEIDVARWSPPPSMIRTVVNANGAGISMVLQAALEELSLDGTTPASSAGPLVASAIAQG